MLTTTEQILLAAVLTFSGLWFVTSIFFPGLYEVYMGPMLLNTYSAPLFSQNGSLKMETFSEEIAKTNAIDSCLYDKDPWSPDIVKFIEPSQQGPRFDKNCKPKTEITQLIESPGEKLMRLSIRPEYVNEYECRYRCVYPKDDHNYLAGNWSALPTNVPTQPPCDVFEVEGNKKGNDTDLYRELYYQIYRQPINITQETKGYGVHILLVDSTSHSNFLRAAPRFTHLLREEYEAIPFPHLNKVGLNSMPNAFAFLMGKQSEDMPASPINNETIKADVGFDFSSRCHVPLDNETSSIVHQFRELGYKTMWAEDWAISTYNWPTCIGYSKPPADHNFKPFTLRTDFWSENSAFGWPHKNAEYYFTSYQQDHCREYYQVLLDYLEQFLRFYDDVEQKLSLTWIVDLNHHNLNSFYRADALLYSTFRKLKRKLENSFLFVMSDHGIRFGPHRNTEVGALEDNNPALFIALPKALRRNVKLNEIMNENARHLISHHDLYATLLSIAKNGHEWNDSDWDSEWPKPDQLTKLPNMHGSSLFHYPMKQPRDCTTLRIPFDYCQCPGKYIKVTKEDDLKVRLALKSLEKLNGDIKSRGFSDKCEELQLDKDATIKLMELVDANYLMKTADDSARTSVRHFKIVFQATPGGGLFSIKIRKLQEEKVEFTADQFERLNKHGDQSKCAQQDAIVMQLCFCKS